MLSGKSRQKPSLGEGKLSMSLGYNKSIKVRDHALVAELRAHGCTCPWPDDWVLTGEYPTRVCTVHFSGCPLAS